MPSQCPHPALVARRGGPDLPAQPANVIGLPARPDTPSL